MKKFSFLLIFIPVAIGISFSKGFSQSAICLDIGQPIDNTTGQIYVNYDVIAATCTPAVRLNFILGPWNSPDDITLHNGKTWQQTYDEMVDSLASRGITIYGLIGAQISYNFVGDLLIDYPSADPADSAQADQWVQDYVYNFVSVVDKFKDRIQTFESYNEPNNWDNGWTSVVCPKWFAKILQDIYLNVKYFNGHDTDPAWQVTLISGALFTFDLNDGSQYLNDTYWYGKNEWAWDWTSQQTGSYPLDGIGQHLYCEQGSTNPTTITSAMNANITGMWNVITGYEGSNTSKKIWISEFGWESTAITEQGQADNLKNSYAFLLNDARVALANWFTLSDWPGGDWGLYYFGNFSAADRKLAYYEFLNVTNCVTSVQEKEETKPTLLFDPSTGNYFLNLPEKEKSEIEIWNSVGEKIIEKEIGSSSWIINKSALGIKTGIYFLRLNCNSRQTGYKIVLH